MKQILKQSSWLFGAQAGTRVISFFYVIYLARVLGVLDFGLYTVALAYFSIISSVADFGFNRFLIREVARDRLQVSQLVWNIAVFRLTLTSVLFAVFAVFLYLFDFDKMRVSLILLVTLALLPQSIAFTFDAVFVAIQKLQFSAIALFISSLTTVLVGLILIGNGFGVWGGVNALIVGQVIYAATLTFIIIRQQGIFLSKVKLSIIKGALLGSLPYGLLSVLGLLYFKIDSVLLSYIKGNFETGIYGVAYKFLEAVTFIPTAFSLALFPVLARIHESSPEDIRKIYFKSLKIMLGLGLVIFLGYILVLPEVIRIFLPKFSQSITAIRILSLSIPFMFIHVSAVQVLLSTDKFLKPVILLSFITLGFNVLANLIFIPRFGFIAAAWITTVSEIFSFAVFYLLVSRKVLLKVN